MRIRLHKKLSSRIKLLLLASLLVVFSAVVVGCGESADSGQTLDSEPIKESPMGTGGTLGTGKVETEPLTLADASRNDNELLDGVFNRLWADPPTLDPHLTSDTTSSGVVVEIFGGLVTFDTDLNLVPDLAESFEISADSLTYTFVIRDTAVFHSGKPVTSSDIKWSLERAANPDTASPVAETYLGDIIGVEDVLNGVTDKISGVAVIDDKTIQIKIDSPKAYFLQKLTYPTAYVLDRENVESGGRNWTDDPNGTGPFKLIEYKIGERLILERHDSYHLGAAGLKRIQMNLAGGSSMAMYENDEIDITGVGLFDLERIKDPSDPLHSDLLVANPSFSISYVGFNAQQPPFDDPKFRQALNHAVNKELIAKEVLADLVVPAYGILPPGFPGHNEKLDGLRYDPVLAKKLLSESAYADPSSRPRIIVTIPGSGGTPNLDLEVIINMWEDELGVEVEIQQVEWATYLRDLDRQKFQAYAGLGWEADYPDPQDFLDILFHSESENNNGAYSNAEVDSILEAARVEVDVVKRMDLYRQAEESIVADAPWLPLWFAGERHLLIKPYVKGYVVTPMIVPKMRHVYIED
ncbi:MAG: ABC transporter substrate-binding protein [Chloroflexi bacterium]|nr:ABC transporter substrate-binding protein [Chloroflexota bacterium]MQG01952.1 peptide ABC transporter substrate-binding protein [SAR202 cluster bacterium]